MLSDSDLFSNQDHKIEKRIRQFMEEVFLVEFDGSMTETTDLFKAGVMDSFGYVQLCRFLEREFGFKFTEEDMLANVMVNLSSMTKTVSNKIKVSSGV
jgi:D-alanine--poly(phosphoribitol) ligase subunit 2